MGEIMCIMCLEIAKNRMTIKEARTALRELLSSPQSETDKDHYEKLARLSDEEFLTETQTSLEE